MPFHHLQLFVYVGSTALLRCWTGCDEKWLNFIRLCFNAIIYSMIFWIPRVLKLLKCCQLFLNPGKWLYRHFSNVRSFVALNKYSCIAVEWMPKTILLCRALSPLSMWTLQESTRFSNCNENLLHGSSFCWTLLHNLYLSNFSVLCRVNFLLNNFQRFINFFWFSSTNSEF